MAPVLACVLVRQISLFRNAPLKSIDLCCKPNTGRTPGARLFQSNKKENSSLGRTKRINLLPVQEAAEEIAKFRSLLRPFLFTVSVCGCSYVGATLWQYENVRKHAFHLRSSGILPPPTTNYKLSSFRRELNRYWHGLSEGQRVVLGIIAANTLVFLSWRIPALQATLCRYFTANPASKSVCLPMLLSTFSHYSLFHLMANMFVLYSFSTAAVGVFGKEQFLGFYISAGVVSSFVSYVHKVIVRSQSFSLGASGAVMGILAAVCLQYPDSKLAIVFLPFFTFPAGVALKCVMGLDALGVALGWKIFDHAAHLGGSIFGAAYLTYGQDLIWKKREPLIRWWHDKRQQGRHD